jgi:hypothetical protein
MSLINSTADRLRRATALWHAYLTITGQRFELAMFLKDPELEKQTIAGALTHGDPKLAALAQEWLRDTGQAVPAAITPTVAAANAPAEAGSKPSRYLRGVRGTKMGQKTKRC